MTHTSIRRWYRIHKWTSLVATLFLLMLCLTGAPLIFRDEIEALTTPPLADPVRPGPAPTLDAIVAMARSAHPGEQPMFMSRDDDAPVYFISTAPGPETPVDRWHIEQYDARNGARLNRPPANSGVIYFILRLHEGLLLDLPGELFLGAMGLCLVASLVSGAVVYGPFMRKPAFGTVRRGRSARIHWLDLHNMLGIVTMAWLMTVGVTGVFNTLSTPVRMAWQRGQLADMTAAFRNAPPLRHLSSVDAAVRTARAAAPGMALSFVAFPGSSFSSAHHYAVFLHGASPLTARLAKPALIDAETGRLTAIREMPLYAKVLFLSEPLHFGDYGGLPLKVIWLLFDCAAIAVLGSGVYLWIGRRRVPIEARLAALATAAQP